MKDKSYKMNGVIISELKRLRLFQAFISLFCSAIWILCLKNSNANKKIYTENGTDIELSVCDDIDTFTVVEKQINKNEFITTFPSIYIDYKLHTLYNIFYKFLNQNNYNS